MATPYNTHVMRHETRIKEPATGSFEEDRRVNENQIDESTNCVEPQFTRSNFFALCLIMTAVFCFYLTICSVVANFMLLCTSRFDFTDGEATLIFHIFVGTLYITPLVGGIISDEWLGKFKTIVIACFICITGLVLLLISSINIRELFTNIDIALSIESRKALFYTGLALFALASGGFDANIGPFGAQQVEHLGSSAIQSFFNWFYWFANAGALIAFTTITYTQEYSGFKYSFISILVAMVFALVVFSIGYKWYLHTPPQGGIYGMMLTQFVSKVTGYSTLSYHYNDDGTGWGTSIQRRDAGIDRGIKALKAIIRVFPIFAFTIPYSAVYWQMPWTSSLQSVRFDLSFSNIQLPAASPVSFNIVFILVMVPIMDRIIYPHLTRCGRNPSPIIRIGFGIVLAIFAVIYFGVIEIVRKNDIADHGFIQQNVSMVTYNASKISVFAQIPEYFLFGMSEVFTFISGLEFAYTEMPSTAKGLMMGVYYLVGRGLGSYLAMLIQLIVSSWRRGDSSDWFPKEPNNGHLEYMLFLLAGLTALSLWGYIAVVFWYKRKKIRMNQSPESDESVTRRDDTESSSILGHPLARLNRTRYSSLERDLGSS